MEDVLFALNLYDREYLGDRESSDSNPPSFSTLSLPDATSSAPGRLFTTFVPPIEPVQATRQLTWLPSRLIGAEEATPARQLERRLMDAGLIADSRATPVAWELFSPIERVVMAVTAVVACLKKEKPQHIGEKAKLMVQLVWGLSHISLTVSMSETMGAIKDQLSDKLATDWGQTFAAEPELFEMKLHPSHWMEGLSLDDDPTKTLEQVLNHTRVRDEKGWEHEFDDKESSRVIIFPIKLSPVMDKEDEKFEDPTIAFNLERPDELLDDTRNFRILGTILASRTTDQGEVKRRCIPYEGLTYPLESIHNLETTASHVLLTFDPQNFYDLKEYVSWNESEDLVCLQVYWDKFSYLFLKKLRHHLGPQVHILAVTDLDVHHLDLLAFLDTPLRHLHEYYGWNMSEQCARLGIQDSIDVDIKWLGIRPKDFADGSPYCSYFDIDASGEGHVDSPDICRSLLDHPHLISSRHSWLVELQTIFDRQLYCRLSLISLRQNSCSRHYLRDFYLPDKIKTCDWC